MVKKILVILGGLVLFAIIVLVVLVFVTPSDYKVERAVTINKSRADIMNYVKLIKNQNEWGPWIKKDPAIKLSYKGNDGEVGFISAWESANKDVGVGEQEIKLVTDKEIDTELRFKEPFASTSRAFLALEEVNATQTKVKWGFTGSMPKPMNLMLAFMDMDKMIGNDFEEGLANLKKIMEQQPK